MTSERGKAAQLMAIAAAFGYTPPTFKVRGNRRAVCPHCDSNDTYTKRWPRCKCNNCGHRWTIPQDEG